MTWDGNYWGTEGEIARFEKKLDELEASSGVFSTAVSRASLYYSARNSALAHCKRGQVWYVARAWSAHREIRLHLFSVFRRFFGNREQVWLPETLPGISPTANECDTLSRILFAVGVPHVSREAVLNIVVELCEIGISKTRRVPDHTLLLLHITLIEAALEWEPDKERVREGVLKDVEEIFRKADFVKDANQRSRVYRGASRLFSKLGAYYRAAEALKKARTVPGVGKDTLLKADASL